jgi:hypothetical protein
LGTFGLIWSATLRHCVLAASGVSWAIEERRVSGDGFAVDANLSKPDANKQRPLEAVGWESMAETRRSVQKYIDTLDDAAWGAASEVKPKWVLRPERATQWTAAMRGHAFFAYATNDLIDLDNAVIVDVEEHRAIRQAGVGSARSMIERTALSACVPWRPQRDRKGLQVLATGCGPAAPARRK